MSTNELYQGLHAEQLRHLLIGPYDYERKLQGGEPAAPAPGSTGPRGPAKEFRW